MKAILLAAGVGSRLRPLTDRVPKCMVPIAGRPLLDHWLEACERRGFEDVLVNTHHHAEAVEGFLRTTCRAVRVRVAHEERLLGTAGTLAANWDFVAGEEVFLFAHADNFTDLDLGRFVAAFRAGRRSDTVMGMALFRTPTPRACGVVRLDGARHVVEFHEKVEEPPGDLANGAIYLGTPALASCLGAGVSDVSTQVIPRLMGRIFGWEIEGFLADIGTPEQYEAWKDGAPPALARRHA